MKPNLHGDEHHYLARGRVSCYKRSSRWVSNKFNYLSIKKKYLKGLVLSSV